MEQQALTLLAKKVFKPDGKTIFHGYKFECRLDINGIDCVMRFEFYGKNDEEDDEDNESNDEDEEDNEPYNEYVYNMYINSALFGDLLYSLCQSVRAKESTPAKVKEFLFKCQFIRKKLVYDKLVNYMIDKDIPAYEQYSTTQLANILFQDPIECCVCLDPSKKVLPKCGHTLCISCAQKNSDHRCPLCRVRYCRDSHDD